MDNTLISDKKPRKEYPPPKTRLSIPAVGLFFFINSMAIPGIKSPSVMISEARPSVFKMVWSLVATKKANTPIITVDSRLRVIMFALWEGINC